MGANVALEMAASGAFCGPLVLLAPSFSRRDESTFIRVLDRLAAVLGYLPFAAMLAIIGAALKGSPLPLSAGMSSPQPSARTIRT